MQSNLWDSIKKKTQIQCQYTENILNNLIATNFRFIYQTLLYKCLITHLNESPCKLISSISNLQY